MKLILIFILIHYIVLFTKKKKGYTNNILACGLFGWVGSDVNKFNKDKFDKLGIYNVTRGRHSCGYAIDGELTKGVGTKAEYTDFIVDNITPSPKETSVVIGHTRAATSGEKNIKNAHPFKFDYGKEGYFIGAHNGTLINDEYLAKKYDVDPSQIDSQILLNIISKSDDNINVLSEYYGAAALLMHTSEKKDTMYLFRGKSKNRTSYTREEEERPLYYWQESKGSMYISSLKEPLYAIMNCEEDKDFIFEVTPNVLYEIKGGEIINKYNIDRSQVREKHTAALAEERAANTRNVEPTNNTQNSRIGTQSVNTTDTNTKKDHRENNIFYEKPLIKNNFSDMNFTNLRFKKNGVLQTGIFVFIDDVGYVKVCDKVEYLKRELKNFKFVDRSISSGPETVILGDISDATLFYMYQGVLLTLPEDYAVCMNPSITLKKKITFGDLQSMSQHPIIDLDRLPTPNTVIPRTKQNIVKDNKLYTGTFSVPGSFKSYTINNGDLTYTRFLDSLTGYNDAKINTLDLYSYIGDSDIDEDDDVDDVSFEENVSDLLNYDNIDELDLMIEILNNYETAITESKQLSESSSNVAKMLSEASTVIEKTLEPVMDVVSKIYAG